MDAGEALKQLIEESSQIEAACLFGRDGAVLASTLPDEAAGARFVAAAQALLAGAERVPAEGEGQLAQLEAALLDGSVFVVQDAERAVAAVTKPEPTVGLVFFDLKSCLRAAAAEGGGDGRPRPRPRSKEASTSESAA